ncbi:Uncharacterised protein g8459 [Pycnogonum litorale]
MIQGSASYHDDRGLNNIIKHGTTWHLTTISSRMENYSNTTDNNNKTTVKVGSNEVGSPPTWHVRKEEVVIVGVVLILWIAVILIFLNRWGKIQMLEPHLPAYKDPSVESMTPAIALNSSLINVDPPSTSVGCRSISIANIGCHVFSSQMYLNRMSGFESAGKNRLNTGFNNSTACMLAIEGFTSNRKTKSVENVYQSTTNKIHNLVERYETFEDQEDV